MFRVRQYSEDEKVALKALNELHAVKLAEARKEVEDWKAKHHQVITK